MDNSSFPQPTTFSSGVSYASTLDATTTVPTTGNVEDTITDSVDTTVEPTSESTEPTVDAVEITNNLELVEPDDAFVYLKDFHKAFGTATCVEYNTNTGKLLPIRDANGLVVLRFLNWLDKAIGEDGTCLDKPEVVYVMKQKFLEDLGVPKHQVLTNQNLLDIWKALDLTPWSKRTNVKSGYTRKKSFVDFDAFKA